MVNVGEDIQTRFSRDGFNISGRKKAADDKLLLSLGPTGHVKTNAITAPVTGSPAPYVAEKQREKLK